MKKSILASVLILGASPCFADENVDFTLSTGVQNINGVQVSYNFDVDENELIKSEDSATGLYADAILGFELDSNSYVSGSFFGSKPKVTLGFGYAGYRAEANSTLIPAGGNSPLDVNGNVIATNFLGGTFISKFQQTQYELGAALNGELETDDLFAPVVGFFVRSKSQEHEVLARYTSQPNNPRSQMDSNLNSRSAGLSLGANLQSPDYAGIRFTASPMVKVSYAKSNLKTVQDKNGNIAGVANGVTRTDSQHHIVVEPSLTLGMNYQIDNITIGAEIFGAYLYGDALIQLSEREGQPARIDTDNDAYAYGGGLFLRMKF